MAETEKIQFHRPANNDEFKQSKLEKDILSYVVLYGCSNRTAYALFHPELVNSKNGKLNAAGIEAQKMFFSHPNNIAYMDAMRAHLEALTKGMVKVTSDEADELTEERKERASKLLMLEVVKMIEDGKVSDPEFAKLVTELALKLKLNKDEAERIIAPIRVLMTRCSECRYRIGVESMVLNGQMLDMCAYCKCRKIAEEHGYHFNDGKDLFEIPKEIIDELESKNNIRMEDILSGEIDN